MCRNSCALWRDRRAARPVEDTTRQITAGFHIERCRDAGDAGAIVEEQQQSGCPPTALPSGLRAQARPPLLLAHHTPRQVSPVAGASPAPLCATAKPELISLLHTMKPQMNTDKHKQQSRNQENLTTKTRRREESPLRCLRVFVVSRMRALPGGRTKALSRLRRTFSIE